MKIEISESGEILVTHKVLLDYKAQRKLINKIVTKDGKYVEEDAHDRWTALYNAYDIVYNTNIRDEHEKYCDKYSKITRLLFLIKTNQINKLIYVATRLYKKEFEEYITYFIEE